MSSKKKFKKCTDCENKISDCDIAYQCIEKGCDIIICNQCETQDIIRDYSCSICDSQICLTCSCAREDAVCCVLCQGNGGETRYFCSFDCQSKNELINYQDENEGYKCSECNNDLIDINKIYY